LKYRSFDELFYDVIVNWSEKKPKIKELENYILSMVTGIFEYLKYMEDHDSLDNELHKGYTLKFGDGIIKLYISDFKVFTGSIDTYENFKDILEEENDSISSYTYRDIENYISNNKRYGIRVGDVDKFLSEYSF